MDGIIDNVKVRVRTHNPNNVEEKEFDNVKDALNFLRRF